MPINDPQLSPEQFEHWQTQSRRLDAVGKVFIVGPPKSGTTWMMNTLQSHPTITARGECGLCQVLVPRFLDVLREYNTHHATYEVPELLFSDTDLRPLIRQMYDRILLRYIGEDPTITHVIDKTPANSVHIDFIAQLYPDASFICCTRDPRDAAVSSWFHYHRAGIAKGDTLEEHAVNWVRGEYRPFLVRAREAGARLGATRYTEVDYDTHVADPIGTTRRVLEYIGAESPDDTVRHCVEGGSFEVWAGRPAGEEDRGSPYRKGIAGDWQNHISEGLGELLLRIAATPLDQPVPTNLPAHA